MAKLPKPQIVLDFDLTKLTENPDNPRVITREGEKKLDSSLAEFGMLDTIIVNRRDNGALMVVGGHQRLKALLRAGESKSAVTFIKVDLVAEKKLNLMLNGHHGDWDGAKLAEALKELQAHEVDLGDLGLGGIAAFESIVSDLQAAAEAEELPGGSEPETREVDPDEFNLKCRCPKCGFQFDKPTTADGRRHAGQGKRAVAGVRPDEDEEVRPAKKTRAHKVKEDDEEEE